MKDQQQTMMNSIMDDHKEQVDHEQEGHDHHQSGVTPLTVKDGAADCFFSSAADATSFFQHDEDSHVPKAHQQQEQDDEVHQDTREQQLETERGETRTMIEEGQQLPAFVGFSFFSGLKQDNQHIDRQEDNYGGILDILDTALAVLNKTAANKEGTLAGNSSFFRLQQLPSSRASIMRSHPQQHLRRTHPLYQNEQSLPLPPCCFFK